jgi:hypothetical protein
VKLGIAWKKSGWKEAPIPEKEPNETATLAPKRNVLQISRQRLLLKQAKNCISPTLSFETGMSRCLEAEIGQNSEFVDYPVGLAQTSSSVYLRRALPP